MGTWVEETIPKVEKNLNSIFVYSNICRKTSDGDHVSVCVCVCNILSFRRHVKMLVLNLLLAYTNFHRNPFFIVKGKHRFKMGVAHLGFAFALRSLIML